MTLSCNGWNLLLSHLEPLRMVQDAKRETESLDPGSQGTVRRVYGTSGVLILGPWFLQSKLHPTNVHA